MRFAIWFVSIRDIDSFGTTSTQFAKAQMGCPEFSSAGQSVEW